MRASLHASHARTGDAPLSEHTFRVQTAEPGGVSFPFSFAVERGTEERLALVVAGRAKGGAEPPGVEAKAVLTFVGRAAAVDLYLSDRCYDLVTPCDALEQTCHPEARACGPVPVVVPRPVAAGDELTDHLAARPSPRADAAASCPPEHTCSDRDYPCEPTSGGGYVCLGQRADWPVPGAATDVRVRYDHARTAGIVFDQLTGLVWQRQVPSLYDGCSGQVLRAGDTCTWNEAKLYCSGLTLAGRRWRLPSKIELESIVEESAGNPPIDPIAFPGTPSRDFWTASPSNDPLVQSSTPQIWNVTFGVLAGVAGTVGHRTAMFVRCVSGSPPAPAHPPSATRSTSAPTPCTTATRDWCGGGARVPTSRAGTQRKRTAPASAAGSVCPLRRSY